MLAVDAHPAGKLHKPACGFCDLRCVQSLLGLVRRSTTALHTATSGHVGPCVRRLPWRGTALWNRPWNRTSRVYTHAPRSKLRSGGHIKTAPVLRRGCWLAHILSGKLHLGKDSKVFSWHGRLHVRPCGLSSPCAIRCDTAESNRLLSLMSGRLPLFQCIA